MLGAIKIDNPEVGEAVIGRDVRGLADVDDALAVGRDLRIGSDLNAENVHGFQPVGNFLSRDGERGKQKAGDLGYEQKEFFRHGGLLTGMHVRSEAGGKSME
jgi:hypothetical protein